MSSESVNLADGPSALARLEVLLTDFSESRDRQAREDHHRLLIGADFRATVRRSSP